MKGLIFSIVYSLSLKEAQTGTKGRNLKAGTEAKVMEQYCLLACFSWILTNFLIDPRPTYPKMALPIDDLPHLLSIKTVT